MIALPRTPAGRIALAIGLSLLVHAIVLFAPMVKLPPSEVPLPPLVAKLEPLPRIAAKPRPVVKPQPKPPIPQPAPAEPEVTQPEPKPAEAEPAKPAQAEAEPQPPAAVEAEKESRPAHPLPRHAQLTFIVSTPSGLEIGEARHRLDIGDDQSYTLKLTANTTGLASLFVRFESNQQSTGMLTAQGLRPNEFSATRNTPKGKETSSVKFDWQAKLLSFADGRETALPEQTQDFISFQYQLSQLPLDKGVVPIYIINGKKLEHYELSVGAEEEIQTRLGKLRVLPVHKVHASGEEGLVIWLGLEYRLLPVKVRYIDRDGKNAGEMVVSDIRVSEEN